MASACVLVLKGWVCMQMCVHECGGTWKAEASLGCHSSGASPTDSHWPGARWLALRICLSPLPKYWGYKYIPLHPDFKKRKHEF